MVVLFKPYRFTCCAEDTKRLPASKSEQKKSHSEAGNHLGYFQYLGFFLLRPRRPTRGRRQASSSLRLQKKRAHHQTKQGMQQATPATMVLFSDMHVPTSTSAINLRITSFVPGGESPTMTQTLQPELQRSEHRRPAQS